MSNDATSEEHNSSIAPKHFLCGVFVVSAILAMPLVHVATSVSFLLMQSLAVRPFQSELTVTDSMDASDGPNQEAYTQMAKLSAASYKDEDVPGWKKLGESVTRAKNFDQLGGATKYLATLYEHAKRYECTLSFSGTDVDDGQDMWRDVLAPPDGVWCQMHGIHRGFAEAMDAYWKLGGKAQVKELITSKNCKDAINTVGHSLGGAKAALLAACANSKNGWLERQFFKDKDLEEVTGDCVKVCGYDTENGKCKKTPTNPIGRRAGTFKNVRKVSDRGCCAGWWGSCISCCKIRPTKPSWPEVKVYTFGAPAIANHQLQNNRRGDHCFQGARFFNYDDFQHHDIVPSIATAFAHRHPKMQAFELSGKRFGKIGTSLGPTRFQIKCSDDWSASAPSSWLRAATKIVMGPAAALYRVGTAASFYHAMTTYVDRVEKSKKTSSCAAVCYVDNCEGTRTNPIPKGEKWRKIIPEAQPVGCCGLMRGACDRCCT